ncbi:hypothetical protein DI005_20640 [Prauserella sp. PE36]|uniref:hypothetical protein n=1 Tax=Prauserella sp. PE36 TaxID=1504709 RepID=UPI000DE3E488|nr:hypothetical protein [Prauserella sp. PE36]RBM17940.1 hypothetical protein DI005_20640 [Prauserella sp. PE36]
MVKGRNMMLRKTGRVILALLTASAVGACSGTVAGQGTPAEPNPGIPAASATMATTAAAEDTAVGLPYGEGFQQWAEAMAPMRTWDPCALHHLDSAEAAIGVPPTSLIPMDTLNACNLALGTQWNITVEMLLLTTMDGWQGGDLDGIRVYRSLPPEGGPTFGISCQFFFPVKEPLGVRVDVTTLREDKTRDDLCAITERYFTDLVPTLKNPPLAAAGHTIPAISLYGKDPCAALTPAADAVPADEVGNENYLVGLDPYSCQWTSEVTIDPIALEYASLFDEGGQPATLGGEPGFIQANGGRCDYVVPVDDPIKFLPGSERTAIPGVKLTLDRCDTERADQIITTALDQPALEPAAGGPSTEPVTLGVLG